MKPTWRLLHRLPGTAGTKVTYRFANRKPSSEWLCKNEEEKNHVGSLCQCLRLKGESAPLLRYKSSIEKTTGIDKGAALFWFYTNLYNCLRTTQFTADHTDVPQLDKKILLPRRPSLPTATYFNHTHKHWQVSAPVGIKQRAHPHCSFLLSALSSTFLHSSTPSS